MPNEHFHDERLSAYLDGELTAVERAEVEARLAADEQFRQRLEELRAVRAVVASLPRASLSTRFAADLMTRLPDTTAENKSAIRLSLVADSALSPERPGNVVDRGDAMVGNDPPSSTKRRWRQARIWFWPVAALAAGLMISFFNPEQPVDRRLAHHDRPDSVTRSPQPPTSMSSAAPAPGPVVMDAFGTDDRWFDGDPRLAERDTLREMGESALPSQTGTDLADLSARGEPNGGVVEDNSPVALIEPPLVTLDLAVNSRAIQADVFYKALERNSIVVELDSAAPSPDSVGTATVDSFGRQEADALALSDTDANAAGNRGAEASIQEQIRSLGRRGAGGSIVERSSADELAAKTPDSHGASDIAPREVAKRSVDVNARSKLSDSPKSARLSTAPSADEANEGLAVVDEFQTELMRERRSLPKILASEQNLLNAGKTQRDFDADNPEVAKMALGTSAFNGATLGVSLPDDAVLVGAVWVEAPIEQIQAAMRELEADATSIAPLNFYVEGAASPDQARQLIEQLAPESIASAGVAQLQLGDAMADSPTTASLGVKDDFANPPKDREAILADDGETRPATDEMERLSTSDSSSTAALAQTPVPPETRRAKASSRQSGALRKTAQPTELGADASNAAESQPSAGRLELKLNDARDQRSAAEGRQESKDSSTVEISRPTLAIKESENRRGDKANSVERVINGGELAPQSGESLNHDVVSQHYRSSYARRLNIAPTAPSVHAASNYSNDDHDYKNGINLGYSVQRRLWYAYGAVESAPENGGDSSQTVQLHRKSRNAIDRYSSVGEPSERDAFGNSVEIRHQRDSSPQIKHQINKPQLENQVNKDVAADRGRAVVGRARQVLNNGGVTVEESLDPRSSVGKRVHASPATGQAPTGGGQSPLSQQPSSQPVRVLFRLYNSATLDGEAPVENAAGGNSTLKMVAPIKAEESPSAAPAADAGSKR